jgi:hypothetical protein
MSMPGSLAAEMMRELTVVFHGIGLPYSVRSLSCSLVLMLMMYVLIEKAEYTEEQICIRRCECYVVDRRDAEREGLCLHVCPALQTT